LASFPLPVDLRPIHQIKVRSGTESNAQAFRRSTNTIWPDQKPFRLLVSRNLARASTAHHVMDQWRPLGMMGALQRQEEAPDRRSGKEKANQTESGERKRSNSAFHGHRPEAGRIQDL
jgi:hypothetical protein